MKIMEKNGSLLKLNFSVPDSRCFFITAWILITEKSFFNRSPVINLLNQVIISLYNFISFVEKYFTCNLFFKSFPLFSQKGYKQ